MTAIPPDGVLLHVGLPGSSIDRLQAALRADPGALPRAGVALPLEGDQDRALLAIARRRGSDRSSERGRTLRQQLAAAAGRALLIGPSLGELRRAARGRLHAAVGRPQHVLITVPPLAQWLPARWEHAVRWGYSGSLSEFLELAATEPSALARRPFLSPWPSAIASGWTELGVPVTIAVDEAGAGALEQLLDLPPGTMAAAATASAAATGQSRPLSSVEVEFVRRVNLGLPTAQLRPRHYDRTVRAGLIAGLITERNPPPSEPPIGVDESQQQRIRELAGRELTALAGLAVDVAGDPQRLVRGHGARAGGASGPALPADVALAGLVGVHRQAVRTARPGPVPLPGVPAARLIWLAIRQPFLRSRERRGRAG
ncbi:MAG: hypothetical protein Q7U41_01860 [Microbacterium sp.]|nr:hypothetical protein [Microbacterium sp.]